ncbi:MAG: winged helix DNA-binding domain-containing protein [Oscillospiraceae bacterium]|jgi:hypothetical protein|nr:winged helix DNA-binding domain-containing protein [Oscillospiraceae bacterium]
MNIEQIQRLRMYNLFLTRSCPDIVTLSRELLGLHSWFQRNVRYSALIRGADISGWKTRLVKTWLYRGTLHGVDPDELPLLLSPHADAASWYGDHFGRELIERVSEDVVRAMEDGVYSRAELRRIFADTYDSETLKHIFSSWGGIFVPLARQGRVAFRSMTSRDFDLIAIGDIPSPSDALSQLLPRYFETYGPATVADAAWFFGLAPELINQAYLSTLQSFALDGGIYYHAPAPSNLPDTPEVALLSGFDPLIVSYAWRGAVMPPEYRCRVVLKSGICMPAVAVRGRIAGLWSIQKREPTVEFFESQPKRIRSAALEQIARIVSAPEN